MTLRVPRGKEKEKEKRVNTAERAEPGRTRLHSRVPSGGLDRAVLPVSEHVPSSTSVALGHVRRGVDCVGPERALRQPATLHGRRGYHIVLCTSIEPLKKL